MSLRKTQATDECSCLALPYTMFLTHAFWHGRIDEIWPHQNLYIEGHCRMQERRAEVDYLSARLQESIRHERDHPIE